MGLDLTNCHLEYRDPHPSCSMGNFCMNAFLDHMSVMLLSWWNSPDVSVVLALTYNIQWVPNKDWLIGRDLLI